MLSDESTSTVRTGACARAWSTTSSANRAGVKTADRRGLRVKGNMPFPHRLRKQAAVLVGVDQDTEGGPDHRSRRSRTGLVASTARRIFTTSRTSFALAMLIDRGPRGIRSSHGCARRRTFQAAADLKGKTPEVTSSNGFCHLMHTCATIQLPHALVAQRAPGCNRSSGAVLEGHRAFFCLGEAAASVEAASLAHPADSKRCSQRLQHVPANAPAQPQDLLENLNFEEPARPTPSTPDPELGYTRLNAGSVPLSK